ncbi:major intrinsic protein [Arthrobacter crystallopoietes BAB-32]|uniref:Major intrinsic protein n=1 Tax=Arthrobacter crystallopoietes BAB-32 TaxID=1246476 RepID=N1VCN1_9MICC|nr:aquaporin [Arthrobacter crystallopoietes]EMY36058.1 major intrinsic protein [Arthrobacter crystallopoietes BAB-32]
MSSNLARQALAELIGTALLVATVVGSGIAAARLSPNDVGLQLLENALATGAVLVALIIALQPVSAAFNPVVTLVERWLGVIGWREAGALIAAQLAGGVLGTMLANLMFDLPAVMISSKPRTGTGLWLAEIVATVGLMLIIFGTARTGRKDMIAVAVGGYITAAYWFTSSTSFANPAVTVARMFSDTFAGIAPASVLPFIAMQVLGGALAALLIRLLYPHPEQAAAEITGPVKGQPS